MRVRAEDHISQIQFLWVPDPSSSEECFPYNFTYPPKCGYDGIAINWNAQPHLKKFFTRPDMGM